MPRPSNRVLTRGQHGALHAVAALPLAAALFVVFNALPIWFYPGDVSAYCPADTLLVMGAAQYDGTPSPVFARRLDRALELYQGGCGDRIVVTGGKREGDRFTEGEAGARYLAQQGVPESALVRETESATSYQNLLYSQRLLGRDRVLIVTDDLHAYRSQWLAQHLGIDAHAAPVPTGRARLRYGLRELMIITAYHLGVIR